jgi:hypothetical protein
LATDAFNGWARQLLACCPLLAFIWNQGIGSDFYVTALCLPTVRDAPYANFMSYCKDYPESPLAEICVLAVVISGLLLLSIAQFARGRRRAPRNALTYLMQLFAILSLVAGTLFYARITSHSYTGHEEWTYIVLAVALVSSFVLALQESIAEVRGEQTAKALAAAGSTEVLAEK